MASFRVAMAEGNCSTVKMPLGSAGSLPSTVSISLPFFSNMMTSPLAGDLKMISMGEGVLAVEWSHCRPAAGLEENPKREVAAQVIPWAPDFPRT